MTERHLDWTEFLSDDQVKEVFEALEAERVDHEFFLETLENGLALEAERAEQAQIWADFLDSPHNNEEFWSAIEKQHDSN